MPPVMQARVSLSPPRDTALRRASSKGDNGLRHGLLTGLHMAIVRTNFIAGAAQIVAESLLHIVSPLHGFLHPITSGKVVQGLGLFCCPHSSGREQAVKDRSAASEIAFYPHAGRSIVSLSNSCARTISLSLRWLLCGASTWAIKRLGRSRKMPSTISLYALSFPWQ